MEALANDSCYQLIYQPIGYSPLAICYQPIHWQPAMVNNKAITKNKPTNGEVTA